MTANYAFQHTILRNAFESLPTRELKSIIITQDQTRAEEIFFTAMQKSPIEMFANLYKFKCEFFIKNNLPVLVYYFDNTIFGDKIVGECFAAAIVATKTNHYYTIEYSFKNNFVIGQLQNGGHINHGFFPADDMESILDRITNLPNDDPRPMEDISQEHPLTATALIASIKKMQKAMLIILSVLFVMAITFPIIAGTIEKGFTSEKSISTRLTSLDANQKIYYTDSSKGTYLYIREDGEIKTYYFENYSMYYQNNSNSRVQVGRATSLQIKQYFGSNLISGTPSFFYIAPAISWIIIIVASFLSIILVFMCINLHKRTQAVLFTLSRQNELFIKNKKAFDDEIISKYEYDKIQKSLLSKKILKNNQLFDLFKFLY